MSCGCLLIAAIFSGGCKSDADKATNQPDAAVNAAPVETVADKPAAEPAPVDKVPVGKLRIEGSDGQVLITNNVPKGKIIRSDGGVLIVAEGQPGEEVDSEAKPEKVETKPEPGKATNDEQIKVRDYFRQIDLLQAGPIGVKPRQFADGLLGDVAKGDYSGFDRLVEDLKAIRVKAEAIIPPQACRQYHQDTLSATDDSLEILENMAVALKSKEMEKLNSLVQKSGAVQKKTKKIEALRKKIEEKYELR